MEQKHVSHGLELSTVSGLHVCLVKSEAAKVADLCDQGTCCHLKLLEIADVTYQYHHSTS